MGWREKIPFFNTYLRSKNKASSRSSLEGVKRFFIVHYPLYIMHYALCIHHYALCIAHCTGRRVMAYPPEAAWRRVSLLLEVTFLVVMVYACGLVR